MGDFPVFEANPLTLVFGKQLSLVWEMRPEICAEVLSPSISVEEMAEKRALYFDAEAREVWLCGLDHKMSFFTPEPFTQSALCSESPSQI
jgi:hypothetical protein